MVNSRCYPLMHSRAIKTELSCIRSTIFSISCYRTAIIWRISQLIVAHTSSSRKTYIALCNIKVAIVTSKKMIALFAMSFCHSRNTFTTKNRVATNCSLKRYIFIRTIDKSLIYMKHFAIRTR